MIALVLMALLGAGLMVAAVVELSGFLSDQSSTAERARLFVAFD